MNFLPVDLRAALNGKPVLIALAYIVMLNVVPALGWLGTWRAVWLPRLRLRK
jgi:hypothetical protein